MVHDVYIIGLWDDGMSYYFVDQNEWSKLSRQSIHNGAFTPYVSWDLLEYSMTPAEFEEFKQDQGDTPLEGTFEDVWSLTQIIELAKLNKINILGTLEDTSF